MKTKLIGLWTVGILALSIPVVYACGGNGGNFVGGQSNAGHDRSVNDTHKKHGKAKHDCQLASQSKKDCGCKSRHR